MVGLGVVLIPTAAALVGKDYLVERNLLPALVPLAAAVAIGLAVSGARRLGLVLAFVLCAYWLAFDVHVTQTPNLQRPDFRAAHGRARPAARSARDRRPGSSPPTRSSSTSATGPGCAHGGAGWSARST